MNSRQAARSTTLTKNDSTIEALESAVAGAVPPMVLVLMWVSGSGKSTVALELHRVLGWPFREDDYLHPPQTHVTRALQASVAGYVTKNAPPEELLEAVRRVADGHTYIEHDLAEELVFSNIRTPSDPLKALSGRDLEILRLLAKGFTLLQIADTVGVSYKTAANNCGQIKAKLGTASTTDLIRIAIQSGLVDRDARFASALPEESRPDP